VEDWSVDTVAGAGIYGPQPKAPSEADQTIGLGEGVGKEAFFYYPAGIAFNKEDGSIIIADSNNHVLRKVRIASSGLNAGLGDSKVFSGVVGVPGNRSFEEIPDIKGRWKKNGRLLDDSANGATESVVKGSNDTNLQISNIRSEDAGVYSYVFSDRYQRWSETPQAFVYVATSGDSPKFLSPGYRIEAKDDPIKPITDLKIGDDIFLYADILPADQVTYQWEVARNEPTAVWIALQDKRADILGQK
jgi:hypothetical protein